MKSKNTFILSILCSVTFLCGFYSGGKVKQAEIEKRSLHLEEKDCFTNRDIEHILFNEPLN